jgi:arylsulfatase A-like enzyme
MQSGLRLLAFVAVVATSLATSGWALGQQVTGTLGSPSATTTVSNKQLPPPDPKFGGVIKDDALQSKPWWAPRVVPPKGAPNVLLIITDDAGFGVPSTFGGVIPTPTMDRIASEGLRYNRVFSTALCSPTRAALITGRNHHSAGFGVISEQSTGFPGYNSIIGKDKATIGRMLLDNGYATSWFGKNHNTPAFAASQVGPFDLWPSGMGFEYFYGFVGGDANQWQPNLFRNTTQIFPFQGNPGWNLITGMADDAIDYMTRIHQIDPSKPIFIKYAPGATHAPHHPTKEWVDKISAMHLFDGGYEKLRETIFANQKKLGLVPKDAKLTPWPNEMLKPWDQLSADEKKLFIRQVEVFAAYAAYNDNEIGRVIQAFQDLGKLDNTLVIYINGDNGTSAEGGPMGTPNEVAFFNGINEMPVDVQMKWYDVWGTEQTYNHMSAGWSWAFDTPFDWFKQNASRLGGINQNMVVSWPARIKDKGALREQFVHVIDVVPTILEAAGIKAPEMVDGIKQAPIEGTSFAYTFDPANAKGGVAAQDAVLRDDGPVGALRRRLATQHQGQPRAVAGLRCGQPRSAEQPGVPALQPGQGLQPDRGHRRAKPAEGQGDAPEVPCRGEEVPGLAAGCVGGGPHRRAAPEHHRRADGIRLHATDGRPAAGRLAVPAELVLHDHRRHHRAAGWRRGHDPDLGRTLRGIRLLPAQGQAGVPVEPGRPQAHQVGRRRGAHPGPAHGGVRFQV